MDPSTPSYNNIDLTPVQRQRAAALILAHLLYPTGSASQLQDLARFIVTGATA